MSGSQALLRLRRTSLHTASFDICSRILSFSAFNVRKCGHHLDIVRVVQATHPNKNIFAKSKDSPLKASTGALALFS